MLTGSSSTNAPALLRKSRTSSTNASWMNVRVVCQKAPWCPRLSIVIVRRKRSGTVLQRTVFFFKTAGIFCALGKSRSPTTHQLPINVCSAMFFHGDVGNKIVHHLPGFGLYILAQKIIAIGGEHRAQASDLESNNGKSIFLALYTKYGRRALAPSVPAHGLRPFFAHRFLVRVRDHEPFQRNDVALDQLTAAAPEAALLQRAHFTFHAKIIAIGAMDHVRVTDLGCFWTIF